MLNQCPELEWTLATALKPKDKAAFHEVRIHLPPPSDLLEWFWITAKGKSLSQRGDACFCASSDTQKAPVSPFVGPGKKVVISPKNMSPWCALSVCTLCSPVLTELHILLSNTGQKPGEPTRRHTVLLHFRWVFSLLPHSSPGISATQEMSVEGHPAGHKKEGGNNLASAPFGWLEMESSSHCRYQLNYNSQRKHTGWSRRKLRRIISITERDGSIFFLHLSPLHKCRSYFVFLLAVATVNPEDQKSGKQTACLLGNFQWQSFLQFLCAIGHSSEVTSILVAVLWPSPSPAWSDCNATSIRPKDRQLPWKCSLWLQRTLDPAWRSGQTPGIPGQPNQPSLTSAAAGTHKDSRDICLTHFGLDLP